MTQRGQEGNEAECGSVLCVCDIYSYCEIITAKLVHILHFITTLFPLEFPLPNPT